MGLDEELARQFGGPDSDWGLQLAGPVSPASGFSLSVWWCRPRSPLRKSAHFFFPSCASHPPCMKGAPFPIYLYGLVLRSVLGSQLRPLDVCSRSLYLGTGGSSTATGSGVDDSTRVPTWADGHGARMKIHGCSRSRAMLTWGYLTEASTTDRRLGPSVTTCGNGSSLAGCFRNSRSRPT